MIEAKLCELKEKLEEADRLIGEILDSEPKESRGEYGREIMKLSDKLDWLEFFLFYHE